MATKATAMDRIVDQVLQPERIMRTLSEFLTALVDDAVGERASEIRRGVGEVPYDPSWMPRFCGLLLEMDGDVSRTAKKLREEKPSSPARSTIYARRKRCPRFDAEWTEALREVESLHRDRRPCERRAKSEGGE